MTDITIYPVWVESRRAGTAVHIDMDDDRAFDSPVDLEVWQGGGSQGGYGIRVNGVTMENLPPELRDQVEEIIELGRTLITHPYEASDAQTAQRIKALGERLQRDVSARI